MSTSEKATFAMNCFWEPDPLFGVAPGVLRTRVGYSGGTKPNPTYEDLGDHTESIEVEYDPAKTSYTNLLKIFWDHHNPTLKQKIQYMSVIFYHNDKQKALAEQSLQDQQKLQPKPVLTEIRPVRIFYNAEDYHQKYYLQKHPELMKMLALSPDQLVESTVAARLQGYITMKANQAAFEEEVKSLRLSQQQADYVRKVMGEGGTPTACGN